MAPRNVVPENPPSSDEDETTESESEEQQHSDHLLPNQNDKQQQETDHDSDSDNSDSDDADENKSPILKKPTMSDPDLDSESTHPSPSLSAFTIKLHKSGSKRSSEPEESTLPPTKKGPAVQRLWSEGDELAVLDGLIKYKLEKGSDPNADMVQFLEFIKDSLHVDVSKTQLSDKIRRMKQKFRTNMERGDPVFSKPHDSKCFELSTKIWGGDEIVPTKGNAKVQTGGPSVTLGLPSSGTSARKKQVSATQQVKNVEKKSRVKSKDQVKTVDKIKEDVETHAIKRNNVQGENVGNLWDKYPLLGDSLNGEAFSKGTKVMLEDKLGKLPIGKLEELELKWKCLKQAELDLFVQRCELVDQQLKLALDFINS
ncbi:DNA-binding storekeeper protein-related transcriptional regulator [Euphorbia peplus]|nr:DNA-binding storekeeper protein-related transcriptional regulator [Euphorbia peplus]